MEEVMESLKNAAMEAVLRSQDLPDDITFHMSVSPEVSQRVIALRKDVLDSVNALMGFLSRDPNQVAPLQNLEDIEDHFNPMVVDVVDDLLEYTDRHLDQVVKQHSRSRKIDKSQDLSEAAQEFLKSQIGSLVTKEKGITDVPDSKITALSPASKKLEENNWQYQSHLMKPQLRFQAPIDNSNSPFIPLLREKLNARVPYTKDADVASKIDSPSVLNHMLSLGIDSEAKLYPHPYEYEIQHIDYPKHMLEHRQEILFPPVDRTPFFFIDTEDEFMALVEKLKEQTEFAVDLEAHDFRSYLGLVCLMQVSTRDEDFIVDTLALRDQMHHLNSSFTDPRIVKVLHGAHGDNQWLQRDYGIYIVNLFDTYHASKVLGFTQHSLAFLLKHYADVTLDKKYQLADWRIRPLTQEMLMYAREDTHYLLYVYDRMRNELLEKRISQTKQNSLASAGSDKSDMDEPDPLAAMKDFLKRCATTALKVYQKPIFTEDSYRTVAINCFPQHAFTPTELILLKHLHRWRDETARKLDESVRYILPNFLLFRLVNRAAAEGQASTASVMDCIGKSSGATAFANAHVKNIVEVLSEGFREVAATTSADEEIRLYELKKQDEKARKEMWQSKKREADSKLLKDDITEISKKARMSPPTAVEGLNLTSDPPSDLQEPIEKSISTAVPVIVHTISKPTTVTKKASSLFDLSSEESGSDDGSDQESFRKAKAIHEAIQKKFGEKTQSVLAEEEEVPMTNADHTVHEEAQVVESVTVYEPQQITDSPQKDIKRLDEKNNYLILSDMKKGKKSDNRINSPFIPFPKTPEQNSPLSEDVSPHGKTMTVEDLRKMSAQSSVSRIGEGSISAELEKSSRHQSFGAVFDPYSELNSKQKSKRQPKSKVWMKSGSKSFTYKN